MTTVQIQLPDALAEEARKAGLLAPEALADLLRQRLRSERLARLQAARELLATNPLPELTPEEILAEIAAYRSEQRRASGS